MCFNSKFVNTPPECIYPLEFTTISRTYQHGWNIFGLAANHPTISNNMVSQRIIGGYSQVLMRLFPSKMPEKKRLLLSIKAHTS